MSATPVYVKTPKGIEEITNRSHGLPMRTRRVLIMLDGKRNAADIAEMFPEEGAVLLDSLIADGFVTPLNAEPEKPTASAKPIAKVDPPLNDAQRFEMAQNFMRNTLEAFLGSMGSGLIAQVNHCTTLDELRNHYQPWRESIALTSNGRKKAADLEMRLAALLS
jgi:hypothetical protein